jgi:hypothetical protein
MVLLPKQVHLQKDVGAGRVGLEGRRGRGESRDGLAGSERQADEGQEEGDEQGEVGVQSGHGWLAGWLAGGLSVRLSHRRRPRRSASLGLVGRRR